MLPEEIRIKVDDKKTVKIDEYGNTSVIEKRVVADGNGITKVTVETAVR